jgi:hypothetical protein
MATSAGEEVDFFAKVLQFEKVADFRIVGSECGKMEGVFNANMRIVQLRLGDQIVELIQDVSPPTGRPIPVPSYSNDEWFERMAIVVSDMDAAYKILKDRKWHKTASRSVRQIESDLGLEVIDRVIFDDRHTNLKR